MAECRQVECPPPDEVGSCRYLPTAMSCLLTRREDKAEQKTGLLRAE
jgi:hypothetical protein